MKPIYLDLEKNFEKDGDSQFGLRVDNVKLGGNVLLYEAEIIEPFLKGTPEFRKVYDEILGDIQKTYKNVTRLCFCEPYLVDPDESVIMKAKGKDCPATFTFPGIDTEIMMIVFYDNRLSASDNWFFSLVDKDILKIITDMYDDKLLEQLEEEDKKNEEFVKEAVAEKLKRDGKE